jgi:hypothetical protein
MLAPLCMAVEVTTDLAQPYLLQRIVDVGRAQLDMAVVLRTGLLMIGLAFVGAAGHRIDDLCRPGVCGFRHRRTQHNNLMEQTISATRLVAEALRPEPWNTISQANREDWSPFPG